MHGADGPGFEEGVFGDIDGGAVEGPARVVDFAAEDVAAAVGGVETVAFGGPCFEGIGWRGDGLERVIGSLEAEVAALVLIVDGVAGAGGGDAGVEIGEVEAGAGDPDGEM